MERVGLTLPRRAVTLSSNIARIISTTIGAVTYIRFFKPDQSKDI